MIGRFLEARCLGTIIHCSKTEALHDGTSNALANGMCGVGEAHAGKRGALPAKQQSRSPVPPVSLLASDQFLARRPGNAASWMSSTQHEAGAQTVLWIGCFP